MARQPKPNARNRPPRIRVPNRERALFSVDNQKFVGVIQRLSLTGGSVVLAKGSITPGTMSEMALRTVFGKVTAQIEFLQTGADGNPLAQAFRFLNMSDASSQRFADAVKQMETAGFSDAQEEGGGAGEGLSQLWSSIRRISTAITSSSAKPVRPPLRRK